VNKPSPNLAVGRAIALTAAGLAGSGFLGRWSMIATSRRLLDLQFDALYRVVSAHRNAPGLPHALAAISTGMAQLHQAQQLRDATMAERALAQLAQHGAALADHEVSDGREPLPHPPLRLLAGGTAA